MQRSANRRRFADDLSISFRLYGDYRGDFRQSLLSACGYKNAAEFPAGGKKTRRDGKEETMSSKIGLLTLAFAGALSCSSFDVAQAAAFPNDFVRRESSSAKPRQRRRGTRPRRRRPRWLCRWPWWFRRRPWWICRRPSWWWRTLGWWRASRIWWRRPLRRTLRRLWPRRGVGCSRGRCRCRLRSLWLLRLVLQFRTVRLLSVSSLPVLNWPNDHRPLRTAGEQDSPGAWPGDFFNPRNPNSALGIRRVPSAP